MGSVGAGSDALGGWTLDVHHAYDPQSRTLYLGDGGRVTTAALHSQLSRTAGIGTDFLSGIKPALLLNLGLIRGVAVGRDGTVYVAETERDLVQIGRASCRERV